MSFPVHFSGPLVLPCPSPLPAMHRWAPICSQLMQLQLLPGRPQPRSSGSVPWQWSLPGGAGFSPSWSRGLAGPRRRELTQLDLVMLCLRLGRPRVLLPSLPGVRCLRLSGQALGSGAIQAGAWRDFVALAAPAGARCADGTLSGCWGPACAAHVGARPRHLPGDLSSPRPLAAHERGLPYAAPELSVPRSLELLAGSSPCVSMLSPSLLCRPGSALSLWETCIDVSMLTAVARGAGDTQPWC